MFVTHRLQSRSTAIPNCALAPAVAGIWSLIVFSSLPFASKRLTLGGAPRLSAT